MADDVDLDGGERRRRRRRPVKGRGKRKFVGLLVTLAAIFGGVYLFYAIGVLEPVLRALGVVREDVSLLEPEAPTFYDLPPTIVQISIDPSKARLMRVTVRLDLARLSDTDRIAGNIPLLVNELQTILRQLRIDDLQDRHTRRELRKLLIRRFSELVPLAQIRDLLFKELTVQ